MSEKRRKALYIHVNLFTLLDLCVSSLRRGHVNLLCIVPSLTDDPRRESIYIYANLICCRMFYADLYLLVGALLARKPLAIRDLNTYRPSGAFSPP